MTRSDDPREPDPLSYSYRETSGQIWWNRISVTTGAFLIAIGSSFLLGRPRR